MDEFFDSTTWFLIRNLTLFFLVVFWLASIYWVYKDARRRIDDPWLVAVATLLGVVPPFIGPLIYMLFRPPEYLEDVRERELDCPVCRAEVDASFLVCPVCTTKLKQACSNCKAPLEAMWQVCPYCETQVDTPSTIRLDGWETPEQRLEETRTRRRRQRRRE